MACFQRGMAVSDSFSHVLRRENSCMISQLGNSREIPKKILGKFPKIPSPQSGWANLPYFPSIRLLKKKSFYLHPLEKDFTHLLSPWTKSKAYDTWDSQAVSDPSTNQAQRCLTCQIGRDDVLPTFFIPPLCLNKIRRLTIWLCDYLSTSTFTLGMSKVCLSYHTTTQFVPPTLTHTQVKSGYDKKVNVIFVLTRSDNPRMRSFSRIWEVDLLGELSIYWLLFKPERLTTWVNYRFIGQNITSENQFSNIYRSMWASPVSSAIDKLSIYWSIIDRYTIFQN